MKNEKGVLITGKDGVVKDGPYLESKEIIGGYYLLEADNLEKIVEMAKEYPRANEVSKDKMRLEFWAWNVVAKEDLIINPHYDKLEVYGTTVYETFGGSSVFFIYFRPMSLKKVLEFSEFTDKSKSEKNVDVSIKPENLRIKVYAGNELLKTNSIQSIKEYTGENNYPITAYIVQVDKPKQIKDNSSFTIFRVEAENTAFNEKGESLFFYEPKIFE